jgi:hypothetical protein
MDWCSELRKKLIIGDNFVRFPPDRNPEYKKWCEDLKVPLDEMHSNMHVCLHHFFIEDYEPFEDNGELKFVLQRTGPTRCKTLGRFSDDKQAPPRPIAPKNQFSLNDFFFLNSKCQTKTLEYFRVIFPPSRSDKTRNRKMNSPIPTASKKQKFMSPGPKIGYAQPFYEGFIGTADKIVELIKAVDDHRSNCLGKLIIRRRFVKTKGLCAIVNCKCSLKNNCKRFWQDGFDWKSASEMKILGLNGKTKTCFVPDVKQALANATTAPLPTHIDQVLRTLGLFPRNMSYISDIERSHIRPNRVVCTI